ncbi:hypothetical protein LCGC14_0482960 [marine sediment metagenome]|uniref:Tip attachment protein J domain-containing protein n=1 Tax=marine sediment metagenome TaxID=412755 RepID=A0A0F9VHQ8_9ZZZZ
MPRPEIQTLYHTVPNVTQLLTVRLTEAYNAAMSQALITCYDTTLGIGDDITFDLGYEGDFGKVFTGYVSNIERGLPEAECLITCHDELFKATEYFIAVDDPGSPLQYSNIKSEDFVEAILNLASITSYFSDIPLEFIWGTNGPVEINLVNTWQLLSDFAGMLAWHLYADRSGVVNYVDRKPYDMGGDSASFTWTTASGYEDIKSISHIKSVRKLRNRVVVYGKNNLSSTASAVSPYLPAGFYKTAVIATPLLDTTSLTSSAANYNLALYNRLTESLTVEIIGDWNVKPRLFANVTDSFTGTSGMWFIYQVEHQFGQGSGYTQNITLTK